MLLGGPISVNDTADDPFLRRKMDRARARRAAGKPTIGICPGARILLRAVGGLAKAGAKKEIGSAPVDLNDAGRASARAELDGIWSATSRAHAPSRRA
ncbi:MAG: hypothetical protein ACK4TB_02410 [Gemmobacter sp.]